MAVAISEYHVTIFASYSRDQRDRGGQVFHFRRHGESRIYEYRHGQLMSGAVVDHPALGGKRHLALLLMFGLLHKAAVTENLQVNEPERDRQAPEQKDSAEQVESGILAENGVGRHGCALRQTPLDKHGGPTHQAEPPIISWGTAEPTLATASNASRSPLPAPLSPSPGRSNPPPRYPCGLPDPGPAAPAPCAAPLRQFAPDRASWRLPSAAHGSSPSNCSVHAWPIQSGSHTQWHESVARHK